MKSTAVLLVLLLAASCIESDAGDIPNSGPSHQYVVSGLRMPQSPADSARLGFDLDGDGQPDNHLGTVLAQLFQANVANMNDVVAELISSGEIVHLIEVEASSLQQSAQAAASMFVGVDMDDETGDNFSGIEEFAIEIADVEKLRGHINRGVLNVGPGKVILKLALPGGSSPFVVDVIAARMDADLEAHAIAGRVGGAITKATVEEKIVPFVHQAIIRQIGLDCPGGECDPDSPAVLFVEVFDRNGDGSVSLAELRGHPVVEVLTKPDVDLLDADGNYAPGADGVLDSLSLAVGLDCVGAEF